MRSSLRQSHLKTIAKIVTLNHHQPAAAIITRAAALIRQGGVVIFPTHGLYGLAADAFNPTAVERIFTLKGRQRAKPLLVMIDQPSQLQSLVTTVPPLAQDLMDAFWPGRITFVLPAVAGLPEGLTSGEGKIGVRLAGHPVAAALTKAAATPITGTSANLSGAGGCAAIEQIDPAVLSSADLILNAGPLQGGPGSTVVDVCGPRPVILRQGAVDGDAIMAVSKRYSQ